MTIGSCRRCGLRPRRVRRGTVEPLCESCYREAMARVARELAAEAAQERRARYRRFNIKPGARPPDQPPERVAPLARAGTEPRSGRRRRPGPRCISEELLREAPASGDQDGRARRRRREATRRSDSGVAGECPGRR
jgi:hypothetical protein